MRILLLGATGRTGKWVLKTALEKGHSVHCLSRNSHRIPQQDGVTVFEGNPTHSDDLKKAITGCEAIIRSEERRVGKECRSRWSPYH